MTEDQLFTSDSWLAQQPGWWIVNFLFLTSIGWCLSPTPTRHGPVSQSLPPSSGELVTRSASSQSVWAVCGHIWATIWVWSRGYCSGSFALYLMCAVSDLENNCDFGCLNWNSFPIIEKYKYKNWPPPIQWNIVTSVPLRGKRRSITIFKYRWGRKGAKHCKCWKS